MHLLAYTARRPDSVARGSTGAGASLGRSHINFLRHSKLSRNFDHSLPNMVRLEVEREPNMKIWPVSATLQQLLVLDCLAQHSAVLLKHVTALCQSPVKITYW